jgi:hypothetical protein
VITSLLILFWNQDRFCSGTSIGFVLEQINVNDHAITVGFIHGHGPRWVRSSRSPAGMIPAEAAPPGSPSVDEPG